MSEETTSALAVDLGADESEKTVSRGFNRAPVTAPAKTDIKPALKVVKRVKIDRTRDDLLTDFGKTTLVDRYLLDGESYQDMFARVSEAYADKRTTAPAPRPAPL